MTLGVLMCIKCKRCEAHCLARLAARSVTEPKLDWLSHEARWCPDRKDSHNCRDCEAPK